MATKDNGTDRIRKNRKKRQVRANRQALLSVVSVRISDAEKKRIDEIMRRDNITRYSDVMKLAIQLIEVPSDDAYERPGIFCR